MKRLLILACLAAVPTPAATAGPLQRLADRLRDRRAERATAPACRPFPAAAAPPLAAAVPVLTQPVGPTPRPVVLGGLLPVGRCGPLGCPTR